MINYQAKGLKTMRISYDEFNLLQSSMRKRDLSQEIIGNLMCLSQIVDSNDEANLIRIEKYIRVLENDAISEIKGMIDNE